MEMASDDEKPYFLEKTLPSRVREYMDKYENINFDYMTQYLIETYPEFKCKKKKVLRKSVIKAYNWEKKQKDEEVYILNGNDNNELESTVTNTEYSNSNGELILNGSSVSNSLKKRKESKVSKGSAKKKRKLDLDNDDSLNLSPEVKQNKFETAIPTVTFADVLGMDPIEEQIFEMYLNFHPDRMEQSTPSKSYLILGPRGAGKTFFIKALAGTKKLPLMTFSAKDLLQHGSRGADISGVDLLDEIFQTALQKCPCILHINNLEVLSCTNAGGTKMTEKQLISAIETHLTDLKDNKKYEQILVVGEFRYIPTQSIDSNLRDTFEETLFVPTLQKKDRLTLLENLTAKLSLEASLEEVAKNCPSFLPGDLCVLVQKTKQMNIRRLHKQFKGTCSTFEYLEKCGKAFSNQSQLILSYDDFAEALKEVVPVLKKDGFPTVPEITMDDIGGMESLKQDIYNEFLLPIEKPNLMKAYSKENRTSGLLLWGPPGCGKTIIAKAVANQAGINFLLISGAEVLKMYQGESERTIREAFALAKSVKPCVIYFDEFEGICPTRSTSSDSGSKGTIVTTLLTEMNGVQSREGVYVMASTNRPDVIDPALLRPGRFDTKLYVGLPDAAARKDIFLAESSNGTLPRFDNAIDLEELSLKCENFSGADCTQLIKMACLNAQISFEEKSHREIGTLYPEDFKVALEKVKPSVSAQALKDYEKLNAKYSRT